MEVAEGNLLSIVDRRIDVIYQVVNLLIERPYPFGDIQIAFQRRRLMDTAHPRQLFDKLRAFLGRNKLGGLHSVNQQLQFWQRKQMTTQGIAVLTAAFLLNVDPNVTELLNIAWNGLAVAGDAACF